MAPCLAAYLDQNVGRGEGQRRIVLEHEVLHVSADTAHNSNDEDEDPGGRLVVLVPLVKSAGNAKRRGTRNGGGCYEGARLKWGRVAAAWRAWHGIEIIGQRSR